MRYMHYCVSINGGIKFCIQISDIKRHVFHIMCEKNIQFRDQSRICVITIFDLSHS